jgi:hypothetical protein
VRLVRIHVQEVRSEGITAVAPGCAALMQFMPLTLRICHGCLSIRNSGGTPLREGSNEMDPLECPLIFYTDLDAV